jgi:aspartate-semialdehyde dehydrogenase
VPRIAIVGATGIVGAKLLEGLSKEEWSSSEIFAYATRGGDVERRVPFRDTTIPVHTATIDPPKNIDFALFAIPNIAAQKLVPAWVKSGIKVVDKSSVFRMDPEVPLVVPEVNGHLINSDTLLVANPNCSTIPLAVVLDPLDEVFDIKEVRVSTYQAVSGAGIGGVEAWQNEIIGSIYHDSPFTKRIHGNVIPMNGSVDEDGNFTEEKKLSDELQKILDKKINIAATAVRVPVEAGHSEAVEIKFESEVDLDKLLDILDSAEGIKLFRDHINAPTPLDAVGLDDVLIGRVRKVSFDTSSVMLWVVSDNLHKGAATNGLQILKKWIEVSE